MADGTKIEWTDATWNPITGCAVVSPGCTNCYAMKLAGTRLKHIRSRVGLTRDTKAGPVWNGEVRFNEEWLDQPLRWKAPRMIFVCAHGDLFTEGVPDAWIDRVFAVMALAPQHTFQVLTKRAERMRAYVTARFGHDDAFSLDAFNGWITTPVRLPSQDRETRLVDRFALKECGRLMAPLPNVWLGVSAEDQKRADERVPILLDTPSAVRWVSAEPLLGPIGFRHINEASGFYFDALSRKVGISFRGVGLDWIVAGGESGTGARPMHPDWVRAIRDQCVAAGVAFHFKQWGEFMPSGQVDATGRLWNGKHSDGRQAYVRYGKKAAGRTLDGVTHNGFPRHG